MSARRPPRDDRRTPRWFFDLCDRRFGPFDLDAAACRSNALCEEWLGAGGRLRDGLEGGAWPVAPGASVWLNPPYGPPGTIAKWIAKAREQRDMHDTRTLMLLPADTSASWFHDVARTELVELVPFRLAFGNGSPGGRNSARFASVLVWIAPTLQRKAVARA